MRQLIRGRTLSFHADPNDTDDAYSYHEDGAIILDGGKIAAIGDYAALRAPDLPETDHRPHLIMPGFIDTHLHFPQVQVIASWGAQLLDWLNTYTFPEEARFADQGHAPAMAEKFLDLLLAHGTTTAVAFCSVHPQSAEALFSAAHARNMAMVAGKVMMDRNAPEAVLDTPQRGYDDSKRLIETWHGKGRQNYAITPRFAITSTPEQMEMTGQLVREYPDCHIQTHLSENRDEIAFTLSLYPQARDYLDIYESYGLLSDKLLLGHSIHLEEREIARMAETGSRAVFCPTSNLFLGSGLFDEAGLRAAGVTCGIATDIGGGTSYSMLQTLNEGYKILQLRGQKLHPYAAFHWVTRGNAIALGMQDRIGTLDVGTDADLVVLDSRATPAMALRMARAETLAEELFILQIMGDDRAIAQTYVAGQAMLD
ncbi:guanine deaminase [Paracoccus halophilus]|uniref:Guanine deaminase n=1 Tax=Paracoccus halophilus TaxID=376733 RepID=A0A099F033_9RHOB|nr:guanine deaminase [Paracoccus halophilus]KGJ04020.1 guanine deaminase [Paracoccus halophilus]SFA44454.1 guanine deaminase [Paracoccus halophilus]